MTVKKPWVVRVAADVSPSDLNFYQLVKWNLTCTDVTSAAIVAVLLLSAYLRYHSILTTECFLFVKNEYTNDQLHGEVTSSARRVYKPCSTNCPIW